MTGSNASYDYDVIVFGGGAPGEPCAGALAEGGLRQNAEASAAARLADEGHLVRVWKRRIASGATNLGGGRSHA